VLDGGMSASTSARLAACLRAANPRGTATILTPDPELLAAALHGLPVSARYPAAVYLPLLACGMLPQSLERALCVDADVIATEDVSPLFDADLGDRALWAARDAPVDAHLDRLAASFPDAHIPPGACYVNTGVMLINLPAWRRQAVGARALRLLREHGDRCVWTNQDAVNVVLAGEISLLPDRWNNRMRGHAHVFPELGAAPRGAPAGIVHFCGRKKPWRGWCLRDELYHRELIASGWHDPLRQLAARLNAPYRAARSLWFRGRHRFALAARARRAIGGAGARAFRS
jgi:lipopolysaccharide biosynthesis glycosyltransferase